MIGVFGVVLLVRACRVRTGSVYALLGISMWVALSFSGVEPVGVGLAMGARWLGTDVLKGIEGAFIIGDSAGNKVDASEFTGSLFASGGGGADTLLGGTSPFGDVLLGDGGNDFVRGGHGPDVLFGGRGRDRLKGQAGKDLLRGEGGNDFLSGGAKNDRLFGGGGSDTMDGGGGRDLCNGGKKPDTARRCERIRNL